MAAKDRTVIFSHARWRTYIDGLDSEEFVHLSDALTLLCAKGASLHRFAAHGRQDNVYEMLFITQGDSVMNGRGYHNKENYDRLICSPVRWMHWGGEAVSLMATDDYYGRPLAPEAAQWRLDTTSQWAPVSQWLLSRYEAALADDTVIKTKKGKVLKPDGKFQSLEDELIDRFGPP